MQGAISNIDGVMRWFKSNESPFFTLSYYNTQSSTGQGIVVGRNVKESDMEIAGDRLKTLIVDQTGYGRAQLHLIVYDKASGANTPSGRTNIDILAGANSGQNGTPGIGSLPDGYVAKSEIQSALDTAKIRWDLEARIQALEAEPEPDFADKMLTAFERIGSTPMGQMLAAKILGAPLPAMLPPAMSGMPTSDDTHSPDADDVETELDDLEKIAEASGLTLKEFLAKTVTLARNQPAMVAMLTK